jgi:hypothetical protein
MASNTKGKALTAIPQEVRDELLALGILRIESYKRMAAIEAAQDSIIEKLTGAKMNDALIADLLAAHNRRAVRTRGSVGMPS